MLQALQEQVREAAAKGQCFEIRGHGSKAWYGEGARGEPLSTLGLSGISAYEPSELVVTVKAGTPLLELEQTLAAQGQCLAFEPPRFKGQGTVGGMVAAGLAGPARATAGSVRDHLLGATLLNGKGELLNFGGTVMKNVAGYDVSRLLAGSMGLLGLIVEVSLKVLPLPVASATLRFDMREDEALQTLNHWGGQPLPVSGSAWWDGALVLRLTGAQAAVASALDKLGRVGGEQIPPPIAQAFWQGLRDQADEFFIGAERAVAAGARLWRLSVPSTVPPLKLSGEQLIEWGGAQRWVTSAAPAAALRDAAAAVGGHATLYRAQDKSNGAFAPLAAPLKRIHQDLKTAFDPKGVFNPGRLYRDL